MKKVIYLLAVLSLSGCTNINHYGNGDIILNQNPEVMNGNKLELPIKKPPLCLPRLPNSSSKPPLQGVMPIV